MFFPDGQRPSQVNPITWVALSKGDGDSSVGEGLDDGRGPDDGGSGGCVTFGDPPRLGAGAALPDLAALISMRPPGVGELDDLVVLFCSKRKDWDSLD
jgi:hypothetical protein